VLQGNGTQFHFDGRHLYLKISDLYSTFPNAFSRAGVDIYSVYNQASRIKIALSCPTKNAAGLCVTPATPDLPSDIAIPITVCNGLADLDPLPLCPNETDTKFSWYPTMNCSDYESWRCTQAMQNTNEQSCRKSCLPKCRRGAPYPYTCSLDRGCMAADKPAPVTDWCAALTSTTALKVSSDPCMLARCNATANATQRFYMPDKTPCFIEDAGGVVLESACRGGDGSCAGISQADKPIKMQRLAADASTSIEATVTLSAGDVSKVTVYYRLSHEAAGLTGATLPALRSGVMTIVSRLQNNITTSNMSAHVRYVLPAGIGRVAGNVTFVVEPTVLNKTTFTFTDWLRTANVNPVAEEKSNSRAGSIELVVTPLDFVSSATLVVVQAATKQFVRAVTVDSVEFLASDTIRFTPAGAMVPTLNIDETFAVNVTLTAGVSLQTTLPCAGRPNESLCSTPTADIRQPFDTCLLRAKVTYATAWYLQLAPDRATPVIANYTVMQAKAGNSTLTKESWGYVFAGGPKASLTTENTTVIANYADGRHDVYWIDARSPPTTGAILQCVRGAATNKLDVLKGEAPVPTDGGSCYRRRCVVGRAPVTTTAPPPTTTVAQPTTTAAPTTVAATTTIPPATSSAPTTVTTTATEGGVPETTIVPLPTTDKGTRTPVSTTTSGPVTTTTFAPQPPTVSATSSPTSPTSTPEPTRVPPQPTVEPTTAAVPRTTQTQLPETSAPGATTTAQPRESQAPSPPPTTEAPAPTPAVTMPTNGKRALYRARVRVRGEHFAPLVEHPLARVRLVSAATDDLADLLHVASTRLEVINVSVGSLVIDYALAADDSATASDEYAVILRANETLHAAATSAQELMPRVASLYRAALPAGSAPEILSITDGGVLQSTAAAPNVDAGDQDSSACTGGCVAGVLVACVGVAGLAAVVAALVIRKRRSETKDEAMQAVALLMQPESTTSYCSQPTERASSPGTRSPESQGSLADPLLGEPSPAVPSVSTAAAARSSAAAESELLGSPKQYRVDDFLLDDDI
jgi:hypothetical protein